MSAPSTRRIKDHGGGGAGASSVKAAALRWSKLLTPVSSSATISGADAFKKSSSEKENRRSISRGAAAIASSQKPAIRPMPRVEKASLVGARDSDEAREGRSTSSVPRGMTPTPSEFDSVLSDTRKDPQVSVVRVMKGPIEEGDRSVAVGASCVKVTNQTIGFRDSNIKGRGTEDNTIKSGLNSEMKGRNSGVWDKKLGESEKNKACISSNLVKSGPVQVKGNLQICGEKGDSDCELKVQANVGISGHNEKYSFVDVGKNINPYLTKNTKDIDTAIEEDSGNECTSSGVGKKYPSRFHEKLAFLEGKIKRIASDIRRTKGTLDMNNPDASKMILSDIQDKISGIERAMGIVTSDSDAKMGFLKSNANDDQELNMVDYSQTKQVEKGICSVIGLNSEELEARLFPHHKLLRNRTLTKASSISCQTNESSIWEPGLVPEVEEKVLSPVDENSIALEFLASLNRETTKVSSRDGLVGMNYSKVQGTDGGSSEGIKDSSSIFNQMSDIDLLLTADEKLDEFDDQENRQGAFIGEETEDTFFYSLNEIGNRTSTAGWFMSEGEAVLLAHDDGSCSYYDIANCEEKTVYTPPSGLSPNIWRDCWIIRASGSDGCYGRFVVAASAGNTMGSGFCSWDFYTKEIRAFQVTNETTNSKTALRPLPNDNVQRRNSASIILAAESRQWWYKPCGPLIISTASSQRTVKVFDVRDGEQIMKWEVQKPVLTMEYSCPLQWRNKGKVVVAESETVSLWDVNSLNPQALQSIPSSGAKISALHVSNTDAELGGGVRQRVSSLEAEGNDGVFCTSDSINILDFRQPSGMGLRISKLGANVQSIFSRGDSLFLGCSSSSPIDKKQPSSSVIQQFSLRRQGLFSIYPLPESNGHLHQSAITQVWGNSNFVMGVCGQGLFVFDALKDDALRALNLDYAYPQTQSAREVIGPADLYWPSFDYMGSRALLISRDRPAIWRQLS